MHGCEGSIVPLWAIEPCMLAEKTLTSFNIHKAHSGSTALNSPACAGRRSSNLRTIEPSQPIGHILYDPIFSMIGKLRRRTPFFKGGRPAVLRDGGIFRRHNFVDFRFAFGRDILKDPKARDTRKSFFIRQVSPTEKSPLTPL